MDIENMCFESHVQACAVSLWFVPLGSELPPIYPYAAKHTKDPGVIELLLKAGALTDIKDKQRKTHWDYARKNKALGAATVLQQFWL